jgi:hypothetical protein
LESSGNKHNISFAILNNIDDDILLRTVEKLDITLADNVEGELIQISAIQVEEKLRASLAEAAYQAHLENLKHKECV